MKNKFKMSIAIGALFFVLGLVTLPHYGINWDTINHLPRGQAYLNFLLTGKKDYSNLSKWEKYWQNPRALGIDSSKPGLPRRSLYQNESATYEWYVARDGPGHPPLSDILSSLFNFVFYQKLGIVNDIDAYRIYSVFLSAVLVGLLYYWAREVKGKFAGIVTVLSLSLYPLFWSESHFNNEKDIPETAYWTFLMFCVWKAVIKKSWKWTLLSGVFFGFALGTKFNVLFSSFVVLPWVFAFLFFNNSVSKRVGSILKEYRQVLLAGVLAIILGLVIFIYFWPYLWTNPIGGIGQVIGFYKGIGLTSNINNRYLGPLNVNTYPVYWITVTTPLVILTYAMIGILRSLFSKHKVLVRFDLLVLLWLFIPIARVSWPGTTIYGGIRQIMEYVPAIALLAGSGASFARNLIISKYNFPKKMVEYSLVILFIPLLINLHNIHPNENAYFNSLVGGLSGAKQKAIPSWGNTFGAAYRQGVNWINDNAEIGSKVVYAHELIPNFPLIFLRDDLILHNQYRSGPLKSGEYAITLTYDGTGNRSYYDSYLENILDPVFTVEVDGVSLLKVWKNDLANTKTEYQKEIMLDDFVVIESEGLVTIDFTKELSMAKIVGVFNNTECPTLDYAYSEVSTDNVKWTRLPGTMPEENWTTSAYGKQPRDGKFIQPFSGNIVRYLRYHYSPSSACFSEISNFHVYYFASEKS